jgi:hypothetical protein
MLGPIARKEAEIQSKLNSDRPLRFILYNALCSVAQIHNPALYFMHII